MIKYLFCFILVCRIFEFGAESPDGCSTAINEWLKDKSRVINVTQSSAFRGNNTRTIITIVAEK